LGSVSLGTVEEVQRALEQAGAEFIERGVRRRKLDEREAAALQRDLHAIAMRSAAHQKRLPRFTDDDLYDENGL
jgi:methylmalonyl-CoA mutase cobalamin-binding subunit